MTTFSKLFQEVLLLFVTKSNAIPKPTEVFGVLLPKEGRRLGII